MVDFDDDVNMEEVKSAGWFFRLGQFLLHHPEPKSFTQRQVDITRATLESASISDILEPVSQTARGWKTVEEHDEMRANLSVAQRRLYAVWWYEAEVRNGGHDQFYSNSYGMLWQDALDGLEAIDAPSARQILLDSVTRFAEPPSRDRKLRNKQAAGLDFHDLDKRLYNNAENLHQLMRKFILAHPGDFLFSGQLSYENPSEFKCMYGKNGFRWERRSA